MKAGNGVRNHLIDKMLPDNNISTKYRLLKASFENYFGKKQPKHFSLKRNILKCE